MTYTTKTGDTFDLIAFRELGSCRHTETLINANRQFVDTIIFRAGVELELPEVSTVKKSKLPPWKTELI